MTTTLLALGNGSYIDPRTITAIRPLETMEDCEGGLWRARVVVTHCQGPFVFHEILYASDLTEAMSMAENFGNLVNSLRTAQPV